MKTILLVDDSVTIRMSMSEVLSTAGYTVEQAGTGEEGLAFLQSPKRIDLVITDLNMPGMNGTAMVREARKLPTRRFIPILMLTTESIQEKRAEAKAAGATGWLVKPVPVKDLLATLQQILP